MSFLSKLTRKHHFHHPSQPPTSSDPSSTSTSTSTYASASIPSLHAPIAASNDNADSQLGSRGVIGLGPTSNSSNSNNNNNNSHNSAGSQNGGEIPGQGHQQQQQQHFQQGNQQQQGGQRNNGQNLNSTSNTHYKPNIYPTEHQGQPSSPYDGSGSSASSSLGGVPSQARTLSGALGVSSSTAQNDPHHHHIHRPQTQHHHGHGHIQYPNPPNSTTNSLVQNPTIMSSGSGSGNGNGNGRTQSVEMTDVSELSLDLNNHQHSSQTPREETTTRPQTIRTGSDTEERVREKAREAQQQAAQAQAALQYASQQARVATINAVATQAAVAQLTGSSVVGMKTPARTTAGRYAFADFAIERTLGTGSFGRVHLVRSRHNARFYAIKVLNKEKVIRMKQVEHTNSEREMLVRVRHPFLVNLWGTFSDLHNLYMVMDFVAGGELFSLLRKSQRFPNSVAKFYAAEVALALDYLHSLDIIYRDLKPENLLLGADGHIKVTDFGFAKYVPDITWTLCGTPDYLAPEVVQSKGYNKSVDWYALGVLIFEMLAGYPPFFTEDGNPMKLYEKIIAGKVKYPSYFDTLAHNLLGNLLTSDITKRYGNLRGGSADIFSHGWFAEVDWDKLYKREIPAPYVPKIEGDGDASQFDRYQEADLSEYGKNGTGPHDHLFPDF